MINRKIQSPNVEVNEYDKSQYDNQTNYSITGTTSLVTGFANKGDDYTARWINSAETLVNTYGYPTNEAERYFYNACYEVLDKRGVLIAAKLPYYNNSLDRISYVSYRVSDELKQTRPHTNVLKDGISVNGKSMYDFSFRTKDVKARVGQHDAVLYNVIDNHNLDIQLYTDLYGYSTNNVNFSYDELRMFEGLMKDDGKVICSIFYDLSSLINETYDPERIQGYVDMSDEAKQEQETILSTLEQKLKEHCGGDFDVYVGKYYQTLSLKYFERFYYGLSSQLCSISANYSSFFPKDDSLSCFDEKYTEVADADSYLTSYIEIEAMKTERSNSGLMDFSTYDKLKTGELKVPTNRIQFLDISRGKYGVDTNMKRSDTKSNEYLGTVPVIVSPVQAMYYQNLIDHDVDFMHYNVLSEVQTPWNISSDSYNHVQTGQEYMSDQISASTDETYTVGQTASEYFPQIRTNFEHFDGTYLKQIGVVVFKMYQDSANDDKIKFVPVESFVGSLNRQDRDPITKGSVFIDDMVNNRSKLVNMFSNVEFTSKDSVVKNRNDKATFYAISNQYVNSMGFFNSDCIKHIHVKKSILDPLDLIFENNKDYNTVDIDLVVDAGVSTIAQFIAATKYNTSKNDENQRYGYFQIDDENTMLFQLNGNDSSRVWRKVLGKYDNFCKNVRKDCMFLADGLRNLCVIGNQKMVRSTAPKNTVQNTVLKGIKYINGTNSSYGAGYCDWFYCPDRYTGDFFWCPPSIKACGVYIYTDSYYRYWDAPAGLNRGRIQNCYDIAFSPTVDEAGVIYNQQWNYAINYPLNGIILEGQKTFQTDKTALDRVNVRRLLLGLEKEVRYIAKFFLYEQNSDFLRQRFKDQVSRIMENAKDREGISEYLVICDGSNNTTETIDRNELHCSIILKPIKSLEFLVLNFICVSQSMQVDESILDNI